MPKKGEYFPPTRAEVERACRMYKSANDAARALRCQKDKFREVCRQYGIAMPHERRSKKKLFDA